MTEPFIPAPPENISELYGTPGHGVLEEARVWAEETFKDHPEVIRGSLGPVFGWYASSRK